MKGADILARARSLAPRLRMWAMIRWRTASNVSVVALMGGSTSEDGQR